MKREERLVSLNFEVRCKTGSGSAILLRGVKCCHGAVYFCQVVWREELRESIKPWPWSEFILFRLC